MNPQLPHTKGEVHYVSGQEKTTELPYPNRIIEEETCAKPFSKFWVCLQP